MKPDTRAYLRRLDLGLQTIFGIRRQGFFIPYRYADRVDDKDVRAPYPFIETLFKECEPRFQSLLDTIEGLRAELLEIGKLPPPEPRFDQVWFPRLDACAAYAMVRRCSPARIVEIGAGHSTRFMTRATRDGKLPTQFITIDPVPRAGLAGLGVQWVEATQSEADPAIWASLQPGDFLFIDSSHICMPGTDVDHLLNRIMPTLPAGVIVHIHDIFLPDPYPTDWSWRGYNEQCAVAPLLQGGAYQPMFASRYVSTRMRDAVARTLVAELPAVDEAWGGSLWLKKMS
jgi:hypothetical protein